MYEGSPQAWRRRHNYLYSRKNQLEKLLEVWGRKLRGVKGKARERNLGVWEAELRDIVAQIAEHERLGQRAGFLAAERIRNGATSQSAKSSSSNKAAYQRASQGGETITGLSKMNTQEIKRRIADLNDALQRIHTKERKKRSVLVAKKEKLTNELRRRKSGTNRKSSWQRWSKAPDKVRFWRGRTP